MWTRSQWMDNINYWSDSRVIEGLITHDAFFIKGSNTQIDMNWVREKWGDWSHYEELVKGEDDWTLEQWNEATEQTYQKWLQSLGGKATVVCESKYHVCTTCQGRGTHVSPSIDSGGITASEWAEWSHEDQDYYMSGAYDVTCSQCHGKRVMQTLEYETNNPLYNWCCERLNEYYESQYESAQEYAWEKRMGC